MTRPAKRFYERVSVAEAAQSAYRVLLDGRALRTPAGATLTLPNAALAEAVAAEWEGQRREINPRAMPLTRLANIAIDHVAARPREVVREVVSYGETDTVCFRVDEPGDLAARQSAAWDPILDWLAERHGVALAATTALAAPRQDPAAIARLEAIVEALDAFLIAGLRATTAAGGSVALALALAAGRVDAEEAWSLALLDEFYQAEKWGRDAEAEDRRAALRSEFDASARLFALCGAAL